ncbi:MAG: hypothetical protein ABFD92_20850 [Planctomycetaceae bacterium]|nr:hypothetical protein [Planctomycetaceae bacterium]
MLSLLSEAGRVAGAPEAWAASTAAAKITILVRVILVKFVLALSFDILSDLRGSIYRALIVDN